MIDSDESSRIFDDFLLDHPEHAGAKHMVEMSDGSTVPFVTLDAVDAFLRWCLIRGYGDALKIIACLTDELPRLRAQFRARAESGRESANGTEPPLG